MIDGVKCSLVGLSVDRWRNNEKLDFGLCVSESTGELITQRREAKSRSMRFIISASHSGRLACSLAGSLHKFFNGNDTNYNAYTFANLCATLDTLAAHYDVNIATATIHALEIGVNIPLDYKPEIILKSAICHKGKPFDRMDHRDKKIGVICTHTDYTVKLYDKGYQSKLAGLDHYILRYEVKLHRSRMLEPFGIKTLADLQSVEKVAPLLSLLTDRLAEIVFFDYKFKATELSELKRLNWERYSNPNYWAMLTHRDYYKARKRYATLAEKYDCIDWGRFISKQTTKQWCDLVETKQKNGGQFPHFEKSQESRKRGTFSDLEYKGENVPIRDVEKRQENESKNSPRHCISCGRQIKSQKQGSLFCSERLFGVEAKRCRNKDSNRRLTIKRKLQRAMSNHQMLRVTYRDTDGATYTDTLAANEILATREWLDRVMSIEVLKPQSHTPAATLTATEAQTYLQTITGANNETTT